MWYNDAKLIILTYIALATYFLDNEKQLWAWLASATDPNQVQATLTDPNFWATVTILSLEHVCYSYLWRNPAGFRWLSETICGTTGGSEGLLEKSICMQCKKSDVVFKKIRSYGSEPWKFVHIILIINKFLQALALLGLLGGMARGHRIKSSGGEIPPCSTFGFECWTSETVWTPYTEVLPRILLAATFYQWALALPMFVMGQVLNVGVYRAIGKEGVYYGYKLGVHVPWVSGFPFNVFRHPQYVGATMSWFAMIFLLASAPEIPVAGLFGIGVVIIVSYVSMSLVESSP